MKIKCILFDADWVVVRWWWQFSLRYQKKYGISYDLMLEFFDWVFRDCLIWKADLKEEIKVFIQKWNWQGDEEELLKYWFDSENIIDEKLIEEILNLKEKWVISYIITNQEKYRTDYLKKEMWFENIFHKVLSSADLWCKKPEQQFYELVLKDLKENYWIEKDEILFFDDSEWNISWAKKVWIESILYKDISDFQKSLTQFSN